MIILQIEHAVANFDAWKKIFDSNADKKKEGVSCPKNWTTKIKLYLKWRKSKIH